MAGRRLDPDERALWARVAATVRPLFASVHAPREGERAQASPAAGTGKQADRPLPRSGVARPPMSPPPSGNGIGFTLDGGWDRRLRQGAIAPERSIDLHGHTLATAHAALDHALERAITDDVRVLLVVTGRAPRGGETRRGLIRAAIGDWLAASRHAGRIAAVRSAHPSHGGAGALYVIFRRRRGG